MSNSVIRSKNFIWTLRILFSLSFLLLLINRLTDFNTSYLKFLMIDFIYTHKLGFLFYVFAIAEGLIALLIYFNQNKVVSVILDFFIFSYLASMLAYFFLLMKVSANCLECNYVTHFLGENLKITITILLGIAVIYSFFLRRQSKTAA